MSYTHDYSGRPLVPGELYHVYSYSGHIREGGYWSACLATVPSGGVALYLGTEEIPNGKTEPVSHGPAVKVLYQEVVGYLQDNGMHFVPCRNLDREPRWFRS